LKSETGSVIKRLVAVTLPTALMCACGIFSLTHVLTVCVLSKHLNVLRANPITRSSVPGKLLKKTSASKFFPMYA